MTAAKDPSDPKRLIAESYNIQGITASECRSIFLDWALSLPVGEDAGPHIRILLDKYSSDAADHPMTQVMKEGLATAPRPRRRGGWRSRSRPDA